MWDRLNTYDYPSIRPDDVRTWFYDNDDDESLAEALAQICNRVTMLHHAVNECDDLWMEYVYHDWAEFEEELVTICIQRLKQRGQLKDVAGWHYQIMPFMVAHGYRDGRSWWIKDKKE